MSDVLIKKHSVGKKGSCIAFYENKKGEILFEREVFYKSFNNLRPSLTSFVPIVSIKL